MTPAFECGDVVACWGADLVSRVISVATASILPPWLFCWAPSHVAVISAPPKSNSPLWFESTTLVEGRYGAQVHLPAKRWHDYAGRCVILRPTVELTGESRQRFAEELDRFVAEGIPYDLEGAILSRLTLLRSCIPDSRRRLFCSELVARAIQVAGLLNWQDPGSFTPGSLCRELLRSGAYEVLRCDT